MSMRSPTAYLQRSSNPKCSTRVAGVGRYDLTDEQWQRLEPLLPPDRSRQSSAEFSHLTVSRSSSRQRHASRPFTRPGPSHLAVERIAPKLLACGTSRGGLGMDDLRIMTKWLIALLLFSSSIACASASEG